MSSAIMCNEFCCYCIIAADAVQKAADAVQKAADAVQKAVDAMQRLLLLCKDCCCSKLKGCC